MVVRAPVETRHQGGPVSCELERDLSRCQPRGERPRERQPVDDGDARIWLAARCGPSPSQVPVTADTAYQITPQLARTTTLHPNTHRRRGFGHGKRRQEQEHNKKGAEEQPTARVMPASAWFRSRFCSIQEVVVVAGHAPDCRIRGRPHPIEAVIYS